MMEVTAAVIWQGDKFLICQRPQDKYCGLLWEFPGGKIEPGETAEECVIRECREELGVTLRVHGMIYDTVQEHPDRVVHIRFFAAEIASGELTPLEHNAVAWVTQAETAGYEFCPADAKLLREKALCRPNRRGGTPRKPWVVSECLAGAPCRYDGGDNLVPEIRAMVDRGEAVAVCPETLGGLPTPRVPSERRGDGRVVSRAGDDVTEAFAAGAERAMALCRAAGCVGAVLKARSPSCGRGVIYDGSFTGRLVPGNGVFAQMLLDAGIPVMTEEAFGHGAEARPGEEPKPTEEA